MVPRSLQRVLIGHFNHQEHRAATVAILEESHAADIRRDLSKGFQTALGTGVLERTFQR